MRCPVIPSSRNSEAKFCGILRKHFYHQDTTTQRNYRYYFASRCALRVFVVSHLLETYTTDLLESFERPLPVDELDVQPRDPVSAGAASAHDGGDGELVM